ncbi:IS3 family transposase [Nocardia sp. NBC_01730]|uniref:IS3 family transposase n=1 Tax=Nocardia sp. NBC_01730 TaxID=2975998 RepID=UPI003FA37309
MASARPASDRHRLDRWPQPLTTRHCLFKTEVVNLHGPFKTLTEVEFALMEWCDWYNNSRLHSRLNYLTPAEYEAAYYSQQPRRRPALV